MSHDHEHDRPAITSELIRVHMETARRERAEAFAQLFGFGFTVLKTAAKSAVAGGKRAVDVRPMHPKAGELA